MDIFAAAISTYNVAQTLQAAVLDAEFTCRSGYGAVRGAVERVCGHRYRQHKRCAM